MPVSVVIATLNRRAVLEYTLEKLSTQVSPQDEIIIVDDGSDDRDAAFFADVSLPCHKTVIRHSTNQGRFVSKNEGMTAARHECIIQLDNDAWLIEKDSLRILEAILDDHPKIGALAIPMHYHNSDKPDECGSLARRWAFMEMQVESTYMGCGVALRRSAVIEAGLYPQFYVYGPEEETLAARLLNVGYEVRGTRRVRCIHGNSVLAAQKSYKETRDNAPELDVASNQLCLATESLAWPVRPFYKGWILVKAWRKKLRCPDVLAEYRRKRPQIETRKYRLSLTATLYWCGLRLFVYGRNAFNRRTLAKEYTLKE